MVKTDDLNSLFETHLKPLNEQDKGNLAAPCAHCDKLPRTTLTGQRSVLSEAGTDAVG